MLNATQIVGLLVIALAAIACFMTPRRKPWRMIGVVYLLLFVDMIGNLRHHLHDWVNAGLMADGLYQQRSGGQMVLLGLLGVVAVLLLVLLWRQKRLPARIGMLTTGGMVLLMLVEMVSLHRVDALLYQPAGPLMTIALIWTLLCLVTAGAAFLDKPASRKLRRHGSGGSRQQRR